MARKSTCSRAPVLARLIKICILFCTPTLLTFACRSRRPQATVKPSFSGISFQFLHFSASPLHLHFLDFVRTISHEFFYAGLTAANNLAVGFHGVFVSFFAVGLVLAAVAGLPSAAQPDEYEKLGSYAMIGLPDVYTTRYGEFFR